MPSKVRYDSCRANSMGGKTTDAGSLNTFGRNEIEVVPISSALLRIACLVILYKTCRAVHLLRVSRFLGLSRSSPQFFSGDSQNLC